MESSLTHDLRVAHAVGLAMDHSIGSQFRRFGSRFLFQSLAPDAEGPIPDDLETLLILDEPCLGLDDMNRIGAILVHGY